MRTRAMSATMLAAVLLAGCGSGGAVSSDVSLDDLGAQMTQPAETLASMIRESGLEGSDEVGDDGTEDRSCDGGHRRVYETTVTVDTASGDDETTVRNRVSLAAQAALKPAGVKVTTELGEDASAVPAALDFSNDPSDEAQKRTYRTTVKVGDDEYVWKITGKTACIAD